MANERVSQLTEITALDIASNDLFLVTDVSAKESKKFEASQLLAFVEDSASIDAFHAQNADTASYVVGSNIHGNAPTSSLSLVSISASHAVNSDLSISASHALIADSVSGGITNAETSSYLLYTGTPNGTASNARTASLADNATQAGFLVYVGGNNGTASYAISSSVSVTSSYSISSSNSLTSSFSLAMGNANTATSASFATTAAFASNAESPVKAWGWVTWSVGVSLPQIYKQNNVSSVKYLGSTFFSPVWWDLFGVTFTNPLDNSDYMYEGSTISSIYGNGLNAHTVLHPAASRSINGFTMSVAVDNSYHSFYYSGSTPTISSAVVTFEIFG